CYRACKMHRSKRIYLLVPILLLVGATLTALLPASEERGAEVLRRGSLLRSRQGSPRDSFTIVMQTYNRTDILLKLLNHYQAMPQLHKIIIVWNSLGEKVPRELWEALGPHPVPVVFKEQEVNLMRNRLQLFPEQETEAVLMLDDDTLISTPDIDFAFSVWKQFPDQIVGFVPRKHVTTPSGVYSYGSFELQDPAAGQGDHYSMVLVGAAFFHKKYLQAFQNQPPEVHRLIDDTQNCDDIAVNFLVAQHTQKPAGVFVKPVDFRNLEKDAASGYQGMWHRAHHLLQRSYCLNRLAQIYGQMPLRYTNIMISQFGFPSYGNHRA
ncbi:EXTL2 protein, partial [Amia calva]|nr:EXTL2 protein [Amia calva]